MIAPRHLLSGRGAECDTRPFRLPHCVSGHLPIHRGRRVLLAVAGIFLAAVNTVLCQPVITTQPQNQTNIVGTTATFRVVVANSPPLAYQWQKFVAADWSNLTDRTNATLALVDVQTSHAGDYRVVVANVDGAVTSAVARLTVLAPPRITYTSLLQNQAVDIGSNALFTVAASGTAPLSYQWRFDGHDLLGETNRQLSIHAAQPGDEGDYTVVVTNLVGTATSEPARLWVVPPASEFIKGNLTNQTGVRLPYFYLLPMNYAPTRQYPLLVMFHGYPGDETMMTNANPAGPGYLNIPGFKTASSFRQQLSDPAIVVWPVRRAGEASGDWSPQYLQLVSNLLDKFPGQVSVDTNRVYVAGFSQGCSAAWDLMGMRSGYFAGAAIGAGSQGSSPPAAVKNVPLWAWCAQDDNPDGTRSFVTAVRRVGGNVKYTEFVSGGHVGAIVTGFCNPAFVNWMLAQRREVPGTTEPLVSIASPTAASAYQTGLTMLNLAGSAAALDRNLTQITWINFANNSKGIASGTSVWSAENIPLVANKTNVVVVVGTTTSWAPAFGGTTTFNDVLTVIQSPIRATLEFQGIEARLSWEGGGPPYRLQKASDLAAGEWTDILKDILPPLTLTLDGTAGFYRIIGQ